MSISVSAGNSLFLFFGIVAAIIIVLMILRPGQTKQKVLSLIIIAAVFIFIYIQFGRPSEILIDKSGIHSEAYGKIDFTWDDVDKALIIEKYEETEWKPTVKTNGSAFIGFRAGKFRLSNGENAKIITQKSRDAVVFKTENGIFLFAVNQHEDFIETASKYITF